MAGDYTIWHNPKCSTSRFVLAALREAGIEPQVRDYLQDPPSVAELRSALAALAMTPRAFIRKKGTPYLDLGLDNPALSDDALLAAMAGHPVLIERPIVFAPCGVRLVRPKETVFDLIAAEATA